MLKLHISNVVELLKMEGTLQFSVNCHSFVYLAYWCKVNYYLNSWNQLKWLISAWRYWFSTDLKVQIQITKWPGDILLHDVHLGQWHLYFTLTDITILRKIEYTNNIIHRYMCVLCKERANFHNNTALISFFFGWKNF